MKKTIFALFAFVGIAACASLFCYKKELRSVAQDGPSLAEVASINNIVIQTFDRTSNLCKVPEDHIFMLPQKWKSFVDERFSREKNKYRALSEAQRESLWPTECAETCTCGFYVGFLEYLDQNGVKLSSRGRSRLIEMSKLASQQDPSESHCVAGAESLCQSSLFEELMRD